MRNFYIESSLGTFISDAAAAEREPKEEPGKPAKGAGSGFSAGVYHSDTRSSVDQISKARSKMGRQRIRRRRRRKRSLTEQQEEEDEEQEQERKQEENTIEVLSRRHGHNKDGVSDDSVSDNVVTKRSDVDNIRNRSSSRSNKSSSKSKSVADVRRNTAKTGRIEEKANAHHRDNTNEATTRITTSKTTFSRPHNSKSADNSVESVVDEKVKVGGERTRMKRESSNSSEKKRKNGANCRNKNVWIENFVYSPTFTVKWRFSQWDLQQLMNGTSAEPPVISFR